MDRKKVAALVCTLLCFSVTGFAANNVKSKVDPFAPNYKGTIGRQMINNSIDKSDKKTVKSVVKSEKKIVKDDNKVVSEKDELKKNEIFAGAEVLSPVQRAIKANAGKFQAVANPTGYYLNGEKVEYPDNTRVIKHKLGKPVKVFVQGKRITNIFLNTDEYIEDIVIDNPEGLRIEKTYEQGRYARWHLSVTPVDNTPGTDMYVVTDKRDYYFKLVPSGNGDGYRQFVRFAYLENRNQKAVPERKTIEKKVEKKKVLSSKKVNIPSQSNKKVSKPVQKKASRSLPVYWGKK